jgi:HEAT repeat protein
MPSRLSPFVSGAAVLALLLAAGCASPEKDLRGSSAKDSDDRLDAANSLAEHVDESDPAWLARRSEIVQALRSLLDDRSALVRQAAIGALGRVEGHAAAPAIIDRLRDREPWVRYVAAKELSRMGSVPEAQEPLTALLREDESADVRRAAADALGDLRVRGAVYDLYLALSDQAPGVRYHAYLALRAITGKDYGLDAKAWRAAVPQTPK